ncbi:Lar family restriction alleviation protein [Ralstonia mannitolilytica]|uniref:Lar family restriction alleviation protein n=1 Tax=Ralstonia mannitolilytica TaxID=105219 RepID=UPI0028F5E279|nr:Lar family restriction alleviation protein [Ralstonia mannitolilytica]CAJ0740887.1 hypothetical protein R76696_03190 [Ralstonia mannitolilytica]
MLSAEQLATYNLKSVRNHGEGVTITAEHGRSIFLPDELLAAICAHRAVVDTIPAQPDAQPVAWLHRHGNHTEVSERQLDDGERRRGWTQEPLFTRPANMPAGSSPHAELLRREADTVSDVIRAIKSLARFKSPLDLPADSHIEIVAREIIASLAAQQQAEPSKTATQGDDNMPKRGTLAWPIRLLQQLQVHGPTSEAKVYINDPTFGRVEVGGALYGIADVELTPNDDDEEAAQRQAEPMPLEAAARRIAAQAREDGDRFIEWLTRDGGLVEMCLSYFRIRQQQAEPVGDELRDCPFCGSDEITIGSFGSSHLSPQHYVKCEQCDGAVCTHDSGADAIAAWNRRAAQSGQNAVPSGDERAEVKTEDLPDWVRNGKCPPTGIELAAMRVEFEGFFKDRGCTDSDFVAHSGGRIPYGRAMTQAAWEAWQFLAAQSGQRAGERECRHCGWMCRRQRRADQDVASA